MFRSITALCLLNIMVMMLLSSLPGVGLCLCSYKLFLGECSCHTEGGTAPCCGGGSADSENKVDAIPACEENCFITLNLEWDLYVYGVDKLASQKIFNFAKVVVCVPYAYNSLALSYSINEDMSMARGSPPRNELFLYSVPRHVWHSSYLI